MNTQPPREWKEFEGRWARASRFRRFIFWSVLIHLLIAVFWGIPRYMLEQEQEELQAKMATREKELEAELAEEFETLQEELAEEDREELAETQLKELFDDVTEDLLSEEEQKEKWEEVKDDLNEELAAIDEILNAEELDTLKAEEKILEAKESMIESLYENVLKETQKDWKKEYMDELKRNLDPLAEKARKELVRQIGKPLAQQTNSFFNKEVRRVSRDIKQATRNLENAARRTQQTQKKLDQTNQTQAKTQAQGKTSPASRKSQNNALTQRQKETAATQKLLGNAAKQLQDIAPKVAKHIADTKTGTLNTAQAALTQGKQEVSRQQDKKALAEGKKASAALTASTQEISVATKAAKRIDAKKVVLDRLRSALKNMEKNELSSKLKKAFEKEFKEKAVPTLAKKINEDFLAEAKRRGVVPPALSIEKEVVELLNNTLPKKINAGETTLAKVKKDQALNKQPEQKKAEGALEKNARKQINAISDKLISTGMKSVVGSLSRNSTTTAIGRKVKSESTTGKRISLLDRLASMRTQMGQGRRGMLGRGNVAALMEGQKRRQSRRSSLKRRSRAAQHTGFDKKAFLTLIQKMKARDGSKGNAFVLAGARGNTSEAKDIKPLPPGIRLAAKKLKSVKTKPKGKRHVKNPTFKYNRFAGVPYLNRPLKIDGDLSDWAKTKTKRLPLTLNRLGRAEPVSNAKAYMRVAYGSAGLYLAVEAEDVTGKIEDSFPVEQFWLNDCVEIFLDTQNTKYHRRGESHTYQFFAFPFGRKSEPQVGGYDTRFGADDSAAKITRYPMSRFTRAAKRTKRGWKAEFFIAREIITKGEFKPGRILGFTVNICVGHPDDYFHWAFHPKLRISTNPHTWGDIQLLGSDADIAILESVSTKKSAAAKVRETIFAGESMRVRVRDADMNLNIKIRDKINVRIAAASGDYEKMILVETGNNTGVFIGTIATRRNIGVNTPNVLEVFDGETGKVIYLDQAQAYGERNVRVISRFSVGSSATRFASK